MGGWSTSMLEEEVASGETRTVDFIAFGIIENGHTGFYYLFIYIM